MSGEPCFIQAPHGSGLDKRQATLQLTIRAEGPQVVRLGIIFRGTGAQDLQPEEQFYYAHLSHLLTVYFQPNAWADESVMLHWLEQFAADTAGIIGILFSCSIKYRNVISSCAYN